MLQLKLTKKLFLEIGVILLLSLPAIISILHNGFFRTDDGNWMVIRFSAFYEALKDGQFPVRFLTRLNSGYGYPVANFLYPGFMYLGVPLKMLGISFVATIKILFAIGMIGSALGMYVWLRTHFARLESYVGMLCYVYLPYHLYDMNVRGSLGEILALAVVPFLIWVLEKRKLFFSSVLVALLVLFHNTLAILFLGVFFLLFILTQKSQKKWILIPYLIGAGLSSFFWLPAVIELRITVFSQTPISIAGEHFAPLTVIGVAFLVLLVVCAITMYLHKERDRKILIYFLICIATLFLSSSVSRLLWLNIPSQFVQFPFRLLSVSIFFAAYIAAYTIKKSPIKIAYSIIFIAILLFSNNYFLARGYDSYTDGYYSTNQATTTVQNEYMPVWVDKIPDTRPQQVVTSNAGAIRDLSYDSNSLSFIVDSPVKTTVAVNRLYYPGWTAAVGSTETRIKKMPPFGVIGFDVPGGSHQVKVIFGETPMRLLADAVSLISFVTLIFYTGFKRR